MGETLGRRENMASPGTRGKSVGVVLAEAEYIIMLIAVLPSYCMVYGSLQPVLPTFISKILISRISMLMTGLIFNNNNNK